MPASAGMSWYVRCTRPVTAPHRPARRFATRKVFVRFSTRIWAIVPATAQELTAIASRCLPAVQRRCNPNHATAYVQDVISDACLKLFARTSDTEVGRIRLEQSLPPMKRCTLAHSLWAIRKHDQSLEHPCSSTYL